MKPMSPQSAFLAAIVHRSNAAQLSAMGVPDAAARCLALAKEADAAAMPDAARTPPEPATAHTCPDTRRIDALDTKREPGFYMEGGWLGKEWSVTWNDETERYDAGRYFPAAGRVVMEHFDDLRAALDYALEMPN